MASRPLSLALLAAAACLTACSSGGRTGSSGQPAGPLGTADPSSFLRTDAEVAVVNFFDMYCPHCQRAAPQVNELYREAAGPGSRVPFYAVGWSNSPLEADKFRTRFAVPFPVIPDPERTISSRYGRFRPPMLIVLRRQDSGWIERFRTRRIQRDREAILAAIRG